MKRLDGNSPFHSNTGEPGPLLCPGMLDRERQILEGFHLYMESEKDRFTDTESRLLLARGWG